jgi:predicted transcriptional regulator
MPASRRSLRQPHRDYYEIIKQILQNIYTKRGGRKSSEIAHRCELTWYQFIRYRDALVSHKLLILSNKRPNQRYEITPIGILFLEVFQEIEDDLRPIQH